MAKVMIESAINGIATKEANPHIGYSPEEIANDAIATCKAGAALIHFHVRKPDGEWCQDVPYYAEVYKRVRSAMGKDARVDVAHVSGRQRRGRALFAFCSSCPGPRDPTRPRRR